MFLSPPTFFRATVHLEPDVFCVVLGRLGHGCWGIYKGVAAWTHICEREGKEVELGRRVALTHRADGDLDCPMGSSWTVKDLWNHLESSHTSIRCQSPRVICTLKPLTATGSVTSSRGQHVTVPTTQTVASVGCQLPPGRGCSRSFCSKGCCHHQSDNSSKGPSVR